MMDTSAISTARAIVLSKHALIDTVEVDPEQAADVVDSLVEKMREVLSEYDKVLEELRQLKPET